MDSGFVIDIFFRKDRLLRFLKKFGMKRQKMAIKSTKGMYLHSKVQGNLNQMIQRDRDIAVCQINFNNG